MNNNHYNSVDRLVSKTTGQAKRQACNLKLIDDTTIDDVIQLLVDVSKAINDEEARRDWQNFLDRHSDEKIDIDNFEQFPDHNDLD